MAVISPISACWAGRPETVVEAFRVSAAGAILAPSAGPEASVVRNGAGDYTLTLTNPFAQLLGHTVQVEQAVPPLLIAAVEVLSQSSVRIRIATAAAATATDAAFAVILICTDSLVP